MSEKENPYQSPQADLVKPDSAAGELTLQEPKACSIGEGWRWIVEGFQLFKLAPWLWIGMLIVAAILYIVIAVIPLLNIVSPLLMYVILAGFMIACHSLQEEQRMEFGQLFAGFQNNTGQLVLLGVIVLVLTLIALVPFFLMVGFSAFGAMASNDPEAISAMFGAQFAIGILVYLALIVPIIMCAWFAPVLIAIHNQTAIEAMKLSFKGCLRNILPFLWYGIISMILYILAAIPLGLGLLVLLPVMIASVYTGHRAIFTQ